MQALECVFNTKIPQKWIQLNKLYVNETPMYMNARFSHFKDVGKSLNEFYRPQANGCIFPQIWAVEYM